MSRIRSYTEMLQYKTFDDRFHYLCLNGRVGASTFGFDRYINQRFYQSVEWKRLRNHVIVRDSGCIFGLEGYEIHGKIYIHHMNPISVEDISESTNFLLDPEYLVCVDFVTHNAIHFGDEKLLSKDPTIRRPNDTCPWRG